jgi:hypothetical protein
VTDLRAVDLPEIRAEMALWHRKYGAEYFTACIENGSQTAYGTDFSASAEGARLASAEAARIEKAELFWVSREMTELCVAAARTMPAWSLQPDDLIAPAGMIYFEDLPSFRAGIPTTAMTWNRCPATIASRVLKGSGVWLSSYAERGWLTQRGIDSSSLRLPMPRLVYNGESIASYGQHETGDVAYTADDQGEIVETDSETLIRSGGALAVFKTACLLMRQELAAASVIEPNRASRKRIQRMQQEAKPVRVIRLRHASNSTGASESDREYHHQWIVRGHWRQQWYPSRQVHRPVWIAPHVKGPEGAPLLGGEKVHAWVR